MSLDRFLPPQSRILPAVLVGLLCAASAAAQERRQTCDLKVENSPELRGFRLGMSLEQIKTRLPKARVLDGKFGRGKVEIGQQALREADPEKARGVDGVVLELIDERVVSLSVSYDSSVKWQSLAQFAAVVSKSLNLPPAWDYGHAGSMTCDGFQIFVNTNYIALHNPGAYEVLKRRELEEADRKRLSFRP